MKRYEMRVGYADAEMVESENGEYVLYSDHLAAIEHVRAECERLRMNAERYQDFRRIVLESEDMWPPYIDDALQAMTVEEFDTAIDAARKERK